MGSALSLCLILLATHCVAALVGLGASTSARASVGLSEQELASILREVAQHSATRDGLSQSLRHEDNFRMSNLVNVRLVGFGGVGGGNVTLDREVLHAHLEEFAHDDEAPPAVLLEEGGGKETDGGEEIDGPALSHKLLFHVEGGVTAERSLGAGRAQRGVAAPQLGSQGRHLDSLALKISRALAARRYATNERDVTLVPAAVIDDLVRADWLSSRARGDAYTVYLLNPGVGHDERKATPYCYTLSSPPSSSPSACLSAMFVGQTGERYAWIDLRTKTETDASNSASESLVRVAKEMLQSAQPGMLPLLFAEGLGRLIVRSSWHLFASPLVFVPLRLRRATVVKERIIFDIFRMTGVQEQPETGTETGGKTSLGVPERWSRLKGIMQDAASMSGDQIEFEEHVISIEDCDLCALALAKARRPSFKGISNSETLTLDSSELHQWLSHLHKEQWMGHHVDEEDERDDGAIRTHNIPIFIYEAANTGRDMEILLDKEHRAIAFDAMVVAVVARGDTGTNPRAWDDEFESAVIAATLGCTYGLKVRAGTSEVSKAISGRTSSLGCVPIKLVGLCVTTAWRNDGDVGEARPRIPFDVTDSAARSRVVSAFLGAAQEARHVVSQYHLAAPDGHSLEQALAPDQYRSLEVRWRIIQRKLAKTLQLCDVHQFQSAISLASTISGDIVGVRVLLAHAIQGLKGFIACERGQGSVLERGGGWFATGALFLVIKVCTVSLGVVCAAAIASALLSSWLGNGGGKGIDVGMGARQHGAPARTQRLTHSFRAKFKAD